MDVLGKTDETKKKGRKPKGGKIITKKDEPEQQTQPLMNIILHLKCSSKELVEHVSKINKMLPELNYNPTNPPNKPTILPYNTVNENNHYTAYNNEIKETPAYKEDNRNEPYCLKCKSKMDKGDDEIEEDDEFISVKDINTKLRQLRIQLNKGTIDKKSACFWCTYEYDNPTCYIPKYEAEGILYAYGSFCRPECAVAFLMKETMDDSTKFERYHLLNLVYGKIFGYTKNIKPAPNPYYMLDKYYGNLTIQEYRKLLKTDHMYMTIDRPMTRQMPEIHEETDTALLSINGQLSQKKDSTTGTYKVKRQSEKSAGPSKSAIIKSTFGMSS